MSRSAFGNSFKESALLQSLEKLDAVIAQDFSGVNFIANPVFDPALKQLGIAESATEYSAAATKIGPRFFNSPGAMRETLIHEEIRHRF